MWNILVSFFKWLFCLNFSVIQFVFCFFFYTCNQLYIDFFSSKLFFIFDTFNTLTRG